MASGRRILDGALVFVCYLLWTGVLLGVAGVGGLWLLGRWRSDSSSSSTYQVLDEHTPQLLAAAALLAAVAGALSYWVDRHVE